MATTVYTSGTTITFTTGTTWSGNTTITSLTSSSNFKIGDVYKITLDTTNTNTGSWTWTTGSATLTSLLANQENAIVGSNLALTDGYTLYATFYTTTQCALYVSPEKAFLGTGGLVATGTYTAAAYNDNSHNPNAGVWLFGLASYVGNVEGAQLQQQ